MWNHLPRMVVAVAALLGVTAEPNLTDTDLDTAAGAPALAFVSMPPEFTATALWAVGLFDQARFDLPPLRYVYHGENPEPCAGRPGLQHAVGAVNVIEICTSEMSSPAQVMLLHETAHAWIDHTLTHERKTRFQELRGWTHWRDYGAAAWHDNGTEQAAEIMVWGLIDRPLAMVRINQNSCQELDAGYRTLTGQAPLHGFRDQC